MSRPIHLTCPTCGHVWTIDYDKLQAYKVVYRGDKRKSVRTETYSLRCPNPAHGEEVTVKLEITEPGS